LKDPNAVPPAAPPDGEESHVPRGRERAISGIRRRIEFAEQLAEQAVAAEVDGDHKAAADFYRQAIDALTLLADEVSAAATDMAAKEANAARLPSRPPDEKTED
jgi:hypothetical protein